MSLNGFSGGLLCVCVSGASRNMEQQCLHLAHGNNVMSCSRCPEIQHELDLTETLHNPYATLSQY